MSRYRKIDPRIWNDSKFRSLSDAGKLAFLFLLTHPHMTAIGAMRGTLAGLAAEIGWKEDAMRDAMRDAIAYGMVVVNEDASFLALPNFIKYNKPEGPNSVIKAWPAALEMLPECPEKRDLAIRCKQFLQGLGENFFAKSDTSGLWDAIEHTISHGMLDAKPVGMSDAMSEPSPIQEQEQEQEQDIERGSPSAPTPQDSPSPVSVASSPKDLQGELEVGDLSSLGEEAGDEVRSAIRQAQTERGKRLPASYVVPQQWLLYARRARPDLPEDQIRMAAESFVAYWSSKPGKDGLKLNWLSTWLNWVRKERAPAPAGAVARQPMLREPSKFGTPESRERDLEIARKYGARVRTR